MLAGSVSRSTRVRAPVLYADATSVFVQIPAETALGPASVQVIGNCDPAPDDPQEVRSNTAMFEIASVQPVLLQVSESVQGAVAVHEDFSLVASEPETPAATEMSTPTEGDAQADASGPAMSPAVPGDIVTVFGTGFGSTDPALASGEIPALSHVLAAESVQLMLGETMIPDDHIVFAGATPDVVGLYQLSAKIPDAMPAGDFAVSLMGGHAVFTGWTDDQYRRACRDRRWRGLCRGSCVERRRVMQRECERIRD